MNTSSTDRLQHVKQHIATLNIEQINQAGKARIHALLKRYHVRGEWFKLPKSVIDKL